MTEAVVATRLARYVLRAAQEQGYDVDQLLKTVGLDFNPLDQDPTRVPLMMPARIYNTLYSRVIWLLQDEAFGLHLKQPIPAGSFRMMCMCMVHCNTLGSAIRRMTEFVSFCRTLSGLNSAPIDPLSREGDSVYMHLPRDSQEFLVAVEDNIIGLSAYLHILRRLLSWLISTPIHLEGVYLRPSGEDHRSQLETLFGCPVHLGSDRNALKFPAAYLSKPIHHDEESLKAFLRSAPYEMTLPNQNSGNDLLSRLRAVVGNDFGQDFPSIGEMAKALNMSVRTLRRRLEERDTTYQHFKDETRMAAAVNYLSRPELKINTVAALMGFDEPSAFHRAFKKWTGKTPGEFRVDNRQI